MTEQTDLVMSSAELTSLAKFRTDRQGNSSRVGRQSDVHIRAELQHGVIGIPDLLTVVLGQTDL